MTHRKLVGGASGGAKVWDADRGNVNGMNIDPSGNGATCYGIRIDGTQVYTAGNVSNDQFQTGPLFGKSKSAYTVWDSLSAPSTFTMVVDPAAAGSINIGVATPSGVGTSLPLPCNASATDVANAMLGTCDSSSHTTFVNPGDFTVTGGPLQTNPVVVTLAGLAGTNHGGTIVSAAGVSIPTMSPFRNTAEAWSKAGAAQWGTGLTGNSLSALMVDSGNVYLGTEPFRYGWNCSNSPVCPAYIVTGSGSAFTLKCWDGTPPNVSPDTTTHPQPVGGYFMVLLSSNNGTTAVSSLTPPLPIGATASQVQTALQATPAASNVGGTITCSGGPLPGASISITLSTLPAGKSWGTICTVTDTLLGAYDNGTALWMLSVIDGSVQAKNAWGIHTWANPEWPAWLSKNGGIIYANAAIDTLGGNPADLGFGYPGCRGDGPTCRTFDASLNPKGDQAGIGSGGAWDVCFNSTGTVCYSASSGGVLGINTDFTTGGFAFDLSSGHLIPAGHIALLSDSVLVATWSNKIGTFSTATGHNIANATLPNMLAPGAGAGGFSPVCIDSNGLIYVGVGNRFVGGSQIDDCVACYDSATLTLQWTHNYTGGAGSSLGSIKSICCEPDGSYVYFGGNRLVVP